MRTYWVEMIISALIVLILVGICIKAFAAPEPQYWQVIMAEAVSEGYDGMYAVACVIRNRGGGLRGFMGAKRPDLGSFVKKQGQRYICMAKEIQEKVFDGDGPDITKGATHFENIGRFNVPYWAKEMQITCKIGNHTFFKEK